MRLLLILLVTLPYLAACKNSSDDKNANLQPDNDSCNVIGLNPKIIGGTSCANPQQSAIVRIVLNDGQGGIAFCTGTMITNTQVLTAGHCFEDAESAALLIGDDSSQQRSIVAVAVTIHPDYLDQTDDENRNDLAILELTGAANLPTMPILAGREVDGGEIASVYGYGLDESQNVSPTLKSGEMKVSDVNDQFIIAKYEGPGSNVCFGDSGGPLIVIHNGQPAVAGTVSFGTRDDCQPGDQNSFVNLQNARAIDFINQVAPTANFL